MDGKKLVQSLNHSFSIMGALFMTFLLINVFTRYQLSSYQIFFAFTFFAGTTLGQYVRLLKNK